MEVEQQLLEEEGMEQEWGELCAEILENWNSPIYSDLTNSFLHENPFSMHDHHQLSATKYDSQRVKQEVDLCSIVSNGPQASFHATQLNQAFSCTNVQPNYEDDYTENLEYLGQKKDKILDEEGSKHEQVEKNVGGMDQPLIPVLLVDTFFNKMLGHGVDGIDIADLNKGKEAKACEGDNLRIILNDTDARASAVTRNYGKEMEMFNSGQISSGSKCNFPMADRIPKGSPISGENSRMPATSTAEIRNCYERSFVSKLRFRLPSNKTIFDINIDNFGENLWRGPGVDISDFFNYGLDEKQWKDYCKLMTEAKFRAGGSGQSKLTADGCRQSDKEGAICELKLNMGVSECLPLMDSKDLSFYDSNVIIEIGGRGCLYENEHIRKDDAEGATPLSIGGDTQHLNRKMINGDKILPFPMDTYSHEDRNKTKQNHKNNDANLTNPSRERKTKIFENNYNVNTHGEALGQNTLACKKIKHNYQSSYGKEMVRLTGSNEMGKQHHSSKKERERSLTHASQRKQKRVGFSHFNHKLRTNLADSLCYPRVKESAREEMENYVSDGVQKESARGIIPANSHNSVIEMELEGLEDINIEEDSEKLKRRIERFKLPLTILKNEVADKSMETERNTLLLQPASTMDSDFKDQRPTRRRKWTSS